MSQFENVDCLRPTVLKYIKNSNEIYDTDELLALQNDCRLVPDVQIDNDVINKIKNSQGLCFFILADLYNAQIFNISLNCIQDKYYLKLYLDFDRTLNSHLSQDTYVLTFVDGIVPINLAKQRLEKHKLYLPNLLSMSFEEEIIINFFLENGYDKGKRYMLFKFVCSDILVERY